MIPKPIATDRGKGNDANTNNKKTDLIFRLQVPVFRQTTLTTVLEAICMVIQSTYEQGYDVSEALENLTPTVIPAPVLQSSPTATDVEKSQWQMSY